ncbi:methyl-accepting chemotaxis protein [Tropicimonas marinistellae]|uniref:methyl-accepting chemotaxis protein n=1 Tax=Tropicimonas marinistellae TaxID=1739787 RepID=UPI000834165C|nr:methyl-accepting chemotaxis protein [Tropicimonas marinistellae]
MLRSILSKLSTRIYGIVALATLLLAILSEILLTLAVESAYDSSERHLGDVVETALSALESIQTRVEHGEITQEEAMALGAESLTAIHYDENGYIFAFDDDFIVKALRPKPEWVGTDKADYTDANGLKLYQAIRESALDGGSGAVTYQFFKPESDIPEEKLSVARYFEPWGWVVGTGSYTADVRESLAHLRHVSLGALGAGLVALIVLSTLLGRSVTRPLNGLIHRMEEMKDGNVDAPVPYHEAQGEIGEMARAIDVFRLALVERAQLETEQAAKDAEIARQREAALEQEREMQRREAEETERRHQEEARQQAERDAQRAEAEAERERNRAEQETVVSSLAGALSAMSQGDLSTRIDQTFPPAYEGLRKDFNEATAKMAELIGSIVEGSQSILLETENLNTAAVELSRRTESQAASLEETAAAVTELTSSVESSTVGAREAAETVTRTKDRSVAGRSVVERTIGAMTEIAESSGKISKITGVIDDIAFQTNLLALNAGVEAARAGDAGRGFAVVASEVRALAQRSSDAAREIAQLISTSGQQVKSGVELVNDSGESLAEIEKLVTEIDGLVGTIAESSVQQATGLSEISTAMNQLDQVTQQNAAMFEETNAAVQALKTQATALERDGASFTLDRGATALRIAS